jgi:hypothetical protein
MITTTWTISQLDRSLSDGAVYTAHWQVVSVDGDYSASAYSTTSFTPDPASPDFVPYADLTEAEVLGWVWASGVDKDATEASLAEQIELQKNPVTATGTPWP